jgi:patatin-like phospholipase/acyl hydrolase
MLQVEFSHLDPDRVARALSLTGGGVRGLFTATVLGEMEQRLGCDLSQRFDVIVGTSVGGILALGLACGISAGEIAKHIYENAQHVFRCPTRANPWGLRATRYKPDNLRKCISDIFGCKRNMMIRDVRRNVVIPSVDVLSNRLVYFSNVDRIGSTTCLNAKVLDVALATSAAPTYFPPHRINESLFLDGGIASNNPDIEALRFCSSVLSRPIDSCFVLSVGTGSALYVVHPADKMNAGALKWMIKYGIIDRIISLQESKASDLVGDLLGDRYLRIDAIFAEEIRLDDAREDTIERLKRHAIKVLEDKWTSDAAKIADFVR